MRKRRGYFGSYAWVVLIIAIVLLLAVFIPELKELIMEILHAIFG